MRVLMFGWEFPPHISGGLGTACFGLTRGLLQNKVEVRFVVPRLFGGEDAGKIHLIDAGSVHIPEGAGSIRKYRDMFTYLAVNANLVPYIAMENERSAFTKSGEMQTDWRETPSARYLNFSGHYGSDLLQEVMRYARVALQIAKDGDFQVIHAHDWLTYPAGVAARAESGKPLIIHVHATEFDRSGENINPTVYEIERRGMEAADRIIAVSNMTRDMIIHRYGIDPSKVITVYNGVTDKANGADIPREKPLNEKIVTFLGRITFQKGPDYFVEAAGKVLKEYPHVRFVMAGSGDMMQRMIERTAQLRINARFHFTGFLKGAEVDRLLAMTDVLVMPSVSEPFGIVPLEAMQAGVPVIISRQSGVAEVLKHAVKVDFWDVDALANAIYGFLKYPPLTQTLRRMGREETSVMTWGASAAAVKKIYHSVTA